MMRRRRAPRHNPVLNIFRPTPVERVLTDQTRSGPQGLVHIRGQIHVIDWGRRSHPAGDSSTGQEAQAGSASRSRWLITAVTPSPRIDTPYNASAISIV